jgi:hypothetical protein
MRVYVAFILEPKDLRKDNMSLTIELGKRELQILCTAIVFYTHRFLLCFSSGEEYDCRSEVVIYTSNFTTQTTMYVDFYNC